MKTTHFHLALWRSISLAILFGVACQSMAWADPPGAAYIFPAGGQRGTKVNVRVGGYCLHGECPFEMTGPGIKTSEKITEMETLWFEGPVIPQPASQRKEDYPRDHAGWIDIAADAALGIRRWQVWTSQGAAPSMKFIVGELPEVIEQEVEGHSPAVEVKLPVTINGRIFPREDSDEWSFSAQAGQIISCQVAAMLLGSPLEAHLEIVDQQGVRLAESNIPQGRDPSLTFSVPKNGTYRVRITDINFNGLQDYVYRLTLTTAPQISWIYPLGGNPGKLTSFELGVAGRKVQTAEVALVADAATQAALEAGPLDVPQVFTIQGEATPAVLMELDSLTEFVEEKKTESGASLPAVFNGRIRQPGEVDEWSFLAEKGDEWEFELRAAHLGSSLDGVLSVVDAQGKALGRAEGQSDSSEARLKFKAAATGTFTLKVEDQFRSRGGPDFAYRVRATKPAGPTFDLQLPADGLSLERSQSVKLKIDIVRRGYTGPIELLMPGLPAGVTLSGEKIAANKTNTQLTLTTAADAPLGVVRVPLQAGAEMDGKEVVRTATLPAARGETVVDSLLVGVAIPTPFKVVGEYVSTYAARGSVHVRKYRLERAGFQGPLTVRLADRQARHLQGVKGPTITVPADAEEFEYPVYLPPYMEIGRTSRSVVMAIGEVEDESGKKHKVSFSSQNQNEQIVILVDPGMLSMTSDQSSVMVTPGGQAQVTIRLERAKEVRLPVKLELVAPHDCGISAQPVSMAANQRQATLTLTFGPQPFAPAQPLLLRATAMREGHPVVAEIPLEMVVEGK